MRNGPYRHSVWIDVFGVVLLGAVVLGGAAYLLSEVGGMTGGATVASAPQNVVSSPGQGWRTPYRGSEPDGFGGFLTSRGISGSLVRRPSPGAPDAGVPFSSEWRHEATPTLTDPSFSSDGQATGWSTNGSNGGERSVRSSPARRWTSGLDQRSTAGQAGGGAWRAEARRFAGRAQALSSRLGQMARASSGDGQKGELADENTRSASGTRSSSDTRDVPSPPAVPIDDHLHWLLAAGLLWGMWRLSGG